MAVDADQLSEGNREVLLIIMNNIQKITDAGMCVGCGACEGCEHITFKYIELGFPAPVVDEKCDNCGACLQKCIYWAENDDEDN